MFHHNRLCKNFVSEGDTKKTVYNDMFVQINVLCMISMKFVVSTFVQVLEFKRVVGGITMVYRL